MQKENQFEDEHILNIEIELSNKQNTIENKDQKQNSPNKVPLSNNEIMKFQRLLSEGS